MEAGGCPSSGRCLEGAEGQPATKSSAGQNDSLEAGHKIMPGLFCPIPQDFFPDGNQSHLGHLLPKLQEVNRCLGDLLSAMGKVREQDVSSLPSLV